jgi:hypothetical protein
MSNDFTITLFGGEIAFNLFDANTLAAKGFADDAAASVATIGDTIATVEEHSEQLGLHSVTLGNMATTPTNVADDNPALFGNPQAARPFAQRLLRVKTRRTGTIRIVIAEDGSSADTATIIGVPVDIAVTADTWATLDKPLRVPAGAIPWVRSISAGLTFAEEVIPYGGEVWFVASGTIGTDTAYSTTTSNGIQIEYEFEGEVSAATRETVDAVGDTGLIGFPAPIVNTGSTTGADFTTILPANPAWKHVTGIRIGHDIAGPGTLFIATVAGGEFETIHSQQTVNVPAGVNVVPLNAEIPEGARVVWQSAVRFQANGGGLGSDFFVGTPVAGASIGGSNPHRMEFQVLTASGLEGRTGALESRVDALENYELRPIHFTDPRIRLLGYDSRYLVPTPTLLRGRRPYGASLDFVGSTPQAGFEFMTDGSFVDLPIEFNVEPCRDETGLGRSAVVLVDGVLAATIAATGGERAYSRTTARIELGSAGTMRRVRVMAPYATNAVFGSPRIAADAEIGSLPAAPTEIYALVAHSWGQGFSAPSPVDPWFHQLVTEKDVRFYNGAIGGQVMDPAHAADVASVVTSDGSDATIFLMLGVNNCLSQTPLATYRALADATLAAARTQSPLARIVAVGEPDYPGQDSLTLKQADYNAEVSDAVDALAGGNKLYIDLGSVSAGPFPDPNHPGTAGHTAIASAIAALV